MSKQGSLANNFALQNCRKYLIHPWPVPCDSIAATKRAISQNNLHHSQFLQLLNHTPHYEYVLTSLLMNLFSAKLEAPVKHDTHYRCMNNSWTSTLNSLNFSFKNSSFRKVLMFISFQFLRFWITTCAFWSVKLRTFSGMLYLGNLNN